MDDRRPTDADVARQAAIDSLVSNAVYLAVMIAVTVAVTRRDTLRRLWLRWERWRKGPPAEYGQALHELRRDIARFEGRHP